MDNLYLQVKLNFFVIDTNVKHSTLEALPLKEETIFRIVHSSDITISWLYTKEICTGPTAFVVAAFCDNPNSPAYSNTFISLNCNISTENITLSLNNLFHDTVYHVKIVATVTGVEGNTTVANLTERTEVAGNN